MIKKTLLLTFIVGCSTHNKLASRLPSSSMPQDCHEIFEQLYDPEDIDNLDREKIVQHALKNTNKSNSIIIPSSDQILTQWGNPSEKEITKDQITILVWNAEKAKREKFKSTFNELAKVSDLLLIQESLQSEHVSTFEVANTNLFWSFARSFIYKKDMAETGVSIGSKVSPTEINFIKTNVREPITGTPKLSLIHKYKIKGKQEQLLVANVHAINFVSDHQFKEELDRLKNEISMHQGPMILAGDFNTWNKNRLAFMTELLQQLNLNETKFNPDLRKKFQNNPLDHFYYRGLKVDESKILNFPDASDHNPLQFKISF